MERVDKDNPFVFTEAELELDSQEGVTNQIPKRTKAYFRHQRRRVINRKTRIANLTSYHFRHSGIFDKGKVHCSCGYCSQKHKTHGPRIADKRKSHYTTTELRDLRNGKISETSM